jgi:hypothetical protein
VRRINDHPARRALELLVVAIIACGPSAEAPVGTSAAATATVSATPSPTTAPVLVPTPTATAPAGRHVFVIVMENTSLNVALRGKYIASLAAQYGLATNYHAVGSPSLPNYLALTSGDTHGIEDNEYRALPAGGLGQQLSAAGVSWRAYMEGVGPDCRVDVGGYAVKHDPFAYYGGACPTNVVPFTALAADLAIGTPRFVWITPDLCHSGHDCSLNEADQWLSNTVPLITNSPTWQSNGVLFIVWDEGGNASDVIPLIVMTPNGGALRSGKRYDHYSLLATMETLLGVSRLGHASEAEVIRDLVPGL